MFSKESAQSGTSFLEYIIALLFISMVCIVGLKVIAVYTDSPLFQMAFAIGGGTETYDEFVENARREDNGPGNAPRMNNPSGRD